MVEQFHPLMANNIIGQDAALATLTDGLLKGAAKHHAWLLTGPKGVGKASLAYHMVVNLLSHDENNDGMVMVPKDNISVEEKKSILPDDGLDLFGDELPDEPIKNFVEQTVDDTPRPPLSSKEDIVKQLREQAHPHFLLLDKNSTDGDGGEDDIKPKPRETKKTQITVGMVRKISSFLAFHGFDKNLPRLVVIDGAEDMNSAAANALLKNLEEPPPNAIFFLISHRPGLLPATIRSRCFILPLHPLPFDKTLHLLAELLPTIDPIEKNAVATLSAGRLGRAAEIYSESGLNMYRDWLDFFMLSGHQQADKKKKILTSLLAQENMNRFQLFLSLVEEFFLRLARYDKKILNDNFFAGEEKIFQLFLARHHLSQWLEFWHIQKMFFNNGFAPKNLNRDYLLVQLLDETREALLPLA
ncbi:MAG: hypothetical protein ACR2NY_02695 [Alphaproteobacteria bacterium]